MSYDASPIAIATAASYSRFSSDQQSERSIADQQRKCREFAARNGQTIPRALEYCDEAISGATHTREGFTAMLAAARTGTFNVLYVESLSRLARDCVLTIQTLRELAYICNIRVVAIDDGIDTAVANWEMICAIFGVQNEQYLKTLGQQVFRGQEGVVLDGYSVGDCCFGFISVDVNADEALPTPGNRKCKKRYAIHTENASWVQRIFHWYVTDRRSIASITRELNNQAAPKDHRSTTKTWRHPYVHRLLKNRKYIGYWAWGRRKNIRNPLTGRLRQEQRSPSETEKWERHFPELQIVDDVTFAKAQELLTLSAKKHGAHRKKNGQLHGSQRGAEKPNPRHLLSGLFVCGVCGQRFQAGGRHGKYLVCPGHRDGTCSCRTQLNRDMAARKLIAAVNSAVFSDRNVRDALLTQAILEYENLQTRLPNERADTAKALADVEKRIASLLDQAEGNTVPELAERLRRRTAERDALRDQLHKLDAEGKRQATPPTAEWVAAQLANVHQELEAQGPAAAHALRQLVGGSIVVTEAPRPGKKRKYLTCCLELSLATIHACANMPGEHASTDAQTTRIEIEFREPPRHEALAADVKQLWDGGLTLEQIGERLSCSHTLVDRALNCWYLTHDEVRPDGRSLRGRLTPKRKAHDIVDDVMELYDQDLLVSEIADRLNCGVHLVRQAVEKHFTDRGLPVPDGRTRRKEIRLRREQAADEAAH